MSQYLVAVYHPGDYDPSVETEATIEAIHALNRELIAAGVRKFACGIPLPPTPSRCVFSRTAKCSSPTGRTSRQRSI